MWNFLTELKAIIVENEIDVYENAKKNSQKEQYNTISTWIRFEVGQNTSIPLQIKNKLLPHL